MSLLEQILNYETKKAEICQNVDFENMEIIEEEEVSMLDHIMNYETRKAEICKGINFDFKQSTIKKQRSQSRVVIDDDELTLVSYPKYGPCINA